MTGSLSQVWVSDAADSKHISTKGELLQPRPTFDLRMSQITMLVPPRVSKMSHCVCCLSVRAPCPACAVRGWQAQAGSALGTPGSGDVLLSAFLESC